MINYLVLFSHTLFLEIPNGLPPSPFLNLLKENRVRVYQIWLQNAFLEL